jgi:hypothetical protein
VNVTRIETELLELERQFWQAIKDRDVDTVMRLTDDTCIIAGAQGVVPIYREGFRHMMQTAPYTLHRFELFDDVQVRVLGDDAAILAYRIRQELTVDGEAITLEAADTSTWMRRNGNWVCVLHTEAIAGDPFGRDKQDRNRP